MTTPDLSEQIQALKALRLDCAARSQALSERELTSRQLRLEIEQQLMAAGKTKTDAEKYAKVNLAYLEAERETFRLVFERERMLAEAEAMLLNVSSNLLSYRGWDHEHRC